MGSQFPTGRKNGTIFLTFFLPVGKPWVFYYALGITLAIARELSPASAGAAMLLSSASAIENSLPLATLLTEGFTACSPASGDNSPSDLQQESATSIQNARHPNLLPTPRRKPETVERGRNAWWKSGKLVNIGFGLCVVGLSHTLWRQKVGSLRRIHGMSGVKMTHVVCGGGVTRWDSAPISEIDILWMTAGLGCD
jgi:hypothetical protein